MTIWTGLIYCSVMINVASEGTGANDDAEMAKILQVLTFPFSSKEPDLTAAELTRLDSLADQLELKRLDKLCVGPFNLESDQLGPYAKIKHSPSYANCKQDAPLTSKRKDVRCWLLWSRTDLHLSAIQENLLRSHR